MSTSPTTPPPPTDSPELTGAGSGGGMDRFRNIISKMSGGGTPLIDQQLARHFQQRKTEYDLAKTQMQSVANEYARAQHDSTTTPDQLDEISRRWEAAKGQYTKIAGTSKEAKPIIQQTIGVIEHLLGHKSPEDQAASQPSPAAGPRPAMTQPPPQAQGAGFEAGPASAAADPTATPTGVTPPTTPPPPQYSKMEAMGAGQREDIAQRQAKVSDIVAEDEGKKTADITAVTKGLTQAGFTPDQIKQVLKYRLGGAGLRAAAKMHPLMVSDPNDPTKKIPALQATIADENGQYPIYDSQGNIMASPTVIVPSMLPTDKTSEMPVYNPATGQIEQQPVYSTSHKVTPTTGKSASGRPATTSPPPGAGRPGSPGRSGIPMRQFTPLQKQATAIDEARNSLAGDDPQKLGGLAADLDVFKSPESVKRLSEYLGLVTQTVENEAKQVAGIGPMAAIEWYANLPQTVVGLQQSALRDASRSLDGGAEDGPEHKFVADYFRTLGTIGGLRASTGASSAQWSFNTLRNELPTPGPVTTYAEAQRRVRNALQETNVVAKRNPMSQPTDVSRLDSAATDLKPPRAPRAGMRWQHRMGANGTVEWREVAQ